MTQENLVRAWNERGKCWQQSAEFQSAIEKACLNLDSVGYSEVVRIYRNIRKDDKAEPQTMSAPYGFKKEGVRFETPYQFFLLKWCWIKSWDDTRHTSWIKCHNPGFSGSAPVHKDDDAEASKAMEECDGTDLDGRTIKCSEAAPRKTV